MAFSLSFSLSVGSGSTLFKNKRGQAGCYQQQHSRSSSKMLPICIKRLVNIVMVIFSPWQTRGLVTQCVFLGWAHLLYMHVFEGTGEEDEDYKKIDSL